MKIYFLGIGGIGMSCLARYFNIQGNDVIGYDRTKTNLTQQLEKEGISINYEDIKENVPNDIDLCIYTPAISENNIQYKYIKQLNIPMQKRAVVLGNITKNKKVLAVAGSHGKTTTCGMIAHILSCSKYGCNAFLGGLLKSINNNFIYNENSEFVVVEADEYDRSFLQLNPFASVITAIDEDHMDIYHTYESLHQAFEQFAMQTNEDGFLLVRNDQKQLIKDLKLKKTVHTYSLHNMEADNYIWNLRISKGSYYFDYKYEDGVLYDMQMTYPGLHNIENAVAALTICIFALKSIGINKQEIEVILREGLKTFSGMQRRLDFRIKTDKRVFIDDYAHHPKEISYTIDSLRELYPKEKITGIFQPHLYSRTQDLANDFAKALEKLDEIILLPIYPAREEPIKGIDSHIILHKINKMDKYLVTKKQLFPLLEALNPKFLITFGAGDIDKLVPEIENLLTKYDE